jgi:hypothetical protein
MTESQTPAAAASLDEVRQGWYELKSKVAQIEAEKTTLENENKLLRLLLERAIEHRQKSHGELVLLLTSLVSKLPINDVGVIISKLVEHNTHCSDYLAALINGATDAPLPQPAMLQTLEHTKRELLGAMKPLVDELVRLDTPLEKGLLESLLADPEAFFSPQVLRANRCFIKGLVPRERVIREFGAEALVFFNDMTTDAKLNPRPKPEEIALSFRSDFETVFGQNPGLPRSGRDSLMALCRRVQRSKSPTPEARAQRSAFQKLSFLIELLHYYEHQSTEPADVIFAQRLPALIEQLLSGGSTQVPDDALVKEAEELLHFIINPDHRFMVINNLGKSSETGKTLKFILRLRSDKTPDEHHVAVEFVRHLIPESQPPPAESVAAVFSLLHPAMQKLVTRTLMHSDRLTRPEAEALGRAVAAKLGLSGLDQEHKTGPAVPPEVERQMAWARIKDMIAHRTDPTTVANTMRERLNSKYDADEIRESWIALTEADPILLIRVFCQLPYLPSGKTDPIARPVLETYITRLLHEKYATTYHRIVTSLKNMFKAKPDAPTLVNFLTLVRWVNPEAANKLNADIGMAVHA